MRRGTLLAAPLVAALVGAGCGGSEPRVTVSASAELKAPFAAYADASSDGDAAFDYGHAAALAAKVRNGDKPDVIASTDIRVADALYADGLVEKPIRIGGNLLEIAIPPGSTEVKSYLDLAKPGMRIAIAAATTPLGIQTRAVLGKLPAAQRAAVLANARVQAPTPAQTAAQVRQGAVDAALMYKADVVGQTPSDADPAHRLGELPFPLGLDPIAPFGAAIVKGAKHPRAARLFIYGLVTGPGYVAVTDAGFEGAPAQ